MQKNCDMLHVIAEKIVNLQSFTQQTIDIMKSVKTWLLLAALLTVSFYGNSQTATPASADSEVRIGIAWRADTDSEFYTNMVRAIIEAGGTPVMLAQVKPYGYAVDSTTLTPSYTDEQGVLLPQFADEIKTMTAEGSNVAESVGTLSAVVFTGGEDISPTLLRSPEAWHGIEAEKDYNATRDVSDYLTMKYCIEQDLPVMGMCRGMQMMSVVSGATVVQDIPTFFASRGISYSYLHRNESQPGQYRDYSPHDVAVAEKASLIYNIAQSDTICCVPSWHHQCVGSAADTPLTVTAYTETQGTDIIEVVERQDKTFCIGLQYHPEAAIVKHLDGADNADYFMDYATAMRYFTALVQQARIHAAEKENKRQQN